MSHSFDGKQLLCDAPGCSAQVAAPVTLTTVLDSAGLPESLSSRWLFAQRSGTWKHFCPDHSASMIANGSPVPRNPWESLPYRNIVLVVDSSSESYQAVKEATHLLPKDNGIHLTVLFVACGRCTTVRETRPSEKQLGIASEDNFCPGTRKALDKYSVLFGERSLPFCFHVHSGKSLNEIVRQDVRPATHEALVVAIALDTTSLPDLPIPVLVLPSQW